MSTEGSTEGSTEASTEGSTEGRRVAALREYDVLGAPPSRALQALTELAALVTAAPMASINLLTADRQHMVAAVGFDATICRREDSMCNAVLSQPSTVLVADASADERFRDNPFVVGPLGRVRFYASHPLVTPDGTTIGRLCVYDEEPYELDEAGARALAVLAARVVDVLELELTRRELELSRKEVALAAERLAGFVSQVSHDLKNPLAAISMSLEMARDEASGSQRDLPEEVLGLIERAGRSAERMRSMIDEVIELARGEAAAPRP